MCTVSAGWIAFVILLLFSTSEAKTVSASKKPFGVMGEARLAYHNYSVMSYELEQIYKQFPERAYLYSIGKSVDKRELWVLAVAAKRADLHMALRPEVKYVANMHGDETVGRQLLLQLAWHLVLGYGHDPDVTQLLDTTRVHLLPSMNPDGFDAAYPHQGECGSYSNTRENSNRVDLNRDFPDYFHDGDRESPSRRRRRQPETEAVMEWCRRVPFVLSANLHGGTLIVNYPYDSHPEDPVLHGYAATADDDVYRHLASTYVKYNPSLQKPCYFDIGKLPESGMINGADWYPIKGGMQDYNYNFHGTLSVTLELSCCKHPIETDLDAFWEANRKALVKYLMHANTGIRGIIAREDGKPMALELYIEGREKSTFRSTSLGEFWRILLPGDYTLVVPASEQYRAHRFTFTVDAQLQPTTLNLTLTNRWASADDPATLAPPSTRADADANHAFGPLHMRDGDKTTTKRMVRLTSSSSALSTAGGGTWTMSISTTFERMHVGGGTSVTALPPPPNSQSTRLEWSSLSGEEVDDGPLTTPAEGERPPTLEWSSKSNLDVDGAVTAIQEGVEWPDDELAAAAELKPTPTTGLTPFETYDIGNAVPPAFADANETMVLLGRSNITDVGANATAAAAFTSTLHEGQNFMILVTLTATSVVSEWCSCGCRLWRF